MKASETRGWKFSAPIADDSEIQCQECAVFSPLAEWEEDSVYCEACGDHDALVCPRCGEYHDYVHHVAFNVRNREQA